MSEDSHITVEIVTARNECLRIAGESAADVLINQRIELTPNAVIATAKQLMAMGKIHVEESVTVTNDRIRVVIDCDVVDDPRVNQAFRQITTAMDELDGALGTVAFGSPIKFESSQIQWELLWPSSLPTAVA